MSDTNNDNTKSIPVLKRKHVRTVEVPVLNIDKLKVDSKITPDSPDFRIAITKAVVDSINKAIPSIVSDVIKALEENAKKVR